jgi:thioesterase domain-containing protein
MNQSGAERPASESADKRALLRSLLMQGPPQPAGVRMSAAQSRLWEIDSHHKLHRPHEFSIVYQLRGELDLDRLEKAFHAVAARHPALRVRITGAGAAARFEPIQLPDRLLEVRETAGDLEELLLEEAARPVDLAVASGWRAVLFREHPGESSLLLHFHHILADRWSVAVLATDLAAAYTGPLHSDEPPAARPGRVAPAAGLPEREEDLDYWKALFNRPPEMLRIPLQRLSHSVASFAGERVEAEIPGALLAGVKSAAAAESSTLFPFLVSAFAALLHTHTAQEDLVICTAMLGRHQPATRSVIGYFNRILPLRLSLAGDPAFRGLMSTVTAQSREMLEHQDTPFQQITALPELTGRRITQCLVSLQHIPGLNLRLPGVSSSYRDVPNGATNFDIALFAEEIDGVLRLLLDFKTGVLERPAAEQLIGRFVEVLQTAAASPGIRLSEFPRYTPQLPASEPPSAVPSRVPDNLLEHRLIQLWREIFPEAGGNQLHADSDFFALGGDSMKAARLFLAIHREFQLDLPLSTLFEAVTPREMAQRMSRQDWAHLWLSLIPLRTKGSRPPLFCIHGGGGNVIGFRVLAEQLGDDQPVYCLQAHGLREGDQPLGSIEEMAANYLESIRQVRPRGPYMLTGHSAGAVVAYEIAQRLARTGEEISFLGLLDHPGPALRLSPVDWLRYHLIFMRTMAAAERIEYMRRSMRWRYRATVARWRIRHGSKPAVVDQPLKRWSRIDLVESALRAIQQYKIEPFPGKLTLFRARHGTPKIHSDPYGGWREIAAAGVEVCEVPGTHLTLLHEPHVRVLGAALARCLDQIASRT